MEILNAFNTLTLKHIFWKMKTTFKKLGTVFQLKVLWLKTQYFHTKLRCQKPMLWQIEWKVQMDLAQKTEFCHWQLSFFENSFSLWQYLTNSLFNVPTTQVSIIILFVTVEVLFEGVVFPLSILQFLHFLIPWTSLKLFCEWL